MQAIVREKRVAVRGPHGLGKTAIAAWVVLWFALTRDGEDWKLPTTASAWRQLTLYLWPEIRKWARQLRWDRIGRRAFQAGKELLQLNLKLRTGEAFAVASNDPAQIEGAHADQIGYLYDEAKTIQDATFDATEGAFSGAGAGEDEANWAFAFAMSTPGEPHGRFYDIHSRKPGYEDWWTRHVTLEECIAAGRISREWAEQRKKQWGEKHFLYQNRVLGEFAVEGIDGVIPLAWVEAAMDRWDEWAALDKPGVFYGLGVDLGGGGEGGDLSVMAPRWDIPAPVWDDPRMPPPAYPVKVAIDELRYLPMEDPLEVSGRVSGILTGWGGRAVIDGIGIGATVVLMLRRLGHAIDSFIASHGSDKRDLTNELGFANRRAEAWWGAREMLDPANDMRVALPRDDRLLGDLCAPKYRVPSGRILIESKDDLRKPERLGRSTDAGDAVIQILCPIPEEDGASMW